MPQQIYFYNNTSLAETITDAQSIVGSQSTSNLVDFQKRYAEIKNISNSYDNIVNFTGNPNVTTWQKVNGKQTLTTSTHSETAGEVTTLVNGILVLIPMREMFINSCLAMGMKTTAEWADRQLFGGLYPAFQSLCATKNVAEDVMLRASVPCVVDANGKLQAPVNYLNDIASACDRAQITKKYYTKNLDLNTDYSLVYDLNINNDFSPIWNGFKFALNECNETTKVKLANVIKTSVITQARNNLLRILANEHLDYNTISYRMSATDFSDVGQYKVTFGVRADAWLVNDPVKFSGKSFNSDVGYWRYQLYDNLYTFVKGVTVTLTYDLVYKDYSQSSEIHTTPGQTLLFGVGNSTGHTTSPLAYGNATTITDIPPEGVEYIGDPLTADGGALSRQYPAWMLNVLNGLVPFGYRQDTAADPQTDLQNGLYPDNSPYPWEDTLPVPDIEPIEGDDPLEPGDPDGPEPYFPDLPDLPSYDANKLFTVHTIDTTNMNTLGGYLWSSSFASLIEHMFSEPIHAVLGLHELHYGGTISTGGSEEIKLGAFGSGAQGNLVTNRYMEFSCGSVKVNEYYSNVEDYDPYTKLQLFLPYIGFVSLATNEVMGKTINVRYGIDVYTGGCVARVIVNSGGVSQELYNFQGQCGCQLPVTSSDYSSLVSRPLIGATLGAVTGGVAGAVTGAVSGLASAKITYNRSNGFNSNTGPMTRQKPMLIIERPIAFNAQSYPAFYGQPTNWTVKLSECSGYTRVKDIHIDKTTATDNEKLEIERLLKEGVIF